jgi:hypothetical protein
MSDLVPEFHHFCDAFVTVRKRACKWAFSQCSDMGIDQMDGGTSLKRVAKIMKQENGVAITPPSYERSNESVARMKKTRTRRFSPREVTFANELEL